MNELMYYLTQHTEDIIFLFGLLAMFQIVLRSLWSLAAFVGWVISGGEKY